MSVIIIGHKEHGKDEFAKAFCKSSGLSYTSSSRFSLERFLYERVRDEYGYSSIEECWADRRNSQEVRDRWAREITAYNTPNKTRLLEEIFAEHGVYVGMRCREELLAAKEKGLARLVIWVDASRRMPPEPLSSMTVTQADATITVDNNGDEQTMLEMADYLGRNLRTLLSPSGQPVKSPIGHAPHPA